MSALEEGMEVWFNGLLSVKVRLISRKSDTVWKFEILEEIPKEYSLPTSATDSAFGSTSNTK